MEAPAPTPIPGPQADPAKWRASSGGKALKTLQKDHPILAHTLNTHTRWLFLGLVGVHMCTHAERYRLEQKTGSTSVRFKAWESDWYTQQTLRSSQGVGSNIYHRDEHEREHA